MTDYARSTNDDEIFRYVSGVLREVTADLDVDEITPHTQLGSLGLESISLVYLIAEIQQHYGLQDRLFSKLRAKAMNIQALRVADVVGYTGEILAARNGAGGGQS